MEILHLLKVLPMFLESGCWSVSEWKGKDELKMNRIIVNIIMTSYIISISTLPILKSGKPEMSKRNDLMIKL